MFVGNLEVLILYVILELQEEEGFDQVQTRSGEGAQVLDHVFLVDQGPVGPFQNRLLAMLVLNLHHTCILGYSIWKFNVICCDTFQP